MTSFRRPSPSRTFDIRALAIVLTSSMLEWLRVLPTWRAQQMLKLITALLHKHNERAWSGRLDALSGRLRTANDSGNIDRLVDAMHEILGCFGGMGSLSDLYLSPQNGHKIKPEKVDAVNARLGALRTQLYLSARQTIARLEWRRSKRPKASASEF